jgi:UDP-glucose 4-epimerase
VHRILVTGAATWVGGRLVQHLEQRSGVRVFAVDDLEPRIGFDSEFARLGLDRLDLARHVLDIQPQTVIHLQTVDRSAELGSTRAHEETVVGAQALFGAIGRCAATRRVVVKSDSAFYGSSPRNPSVLGEDVEPRGSRDHYQRDLGEMERFIMEMAKTHDRVEYTVLRLAPILGARLGNSISRYLTLPAVPTLLGFDPRMQFIAEDDAVRALVHTIDHGVAGTFNVAAPGQLYLSRVLRLGLRIPQPLPGRLFDSALRGLARFDLRVPEHIVSLLKHGRVMDTTLMTTMLGFAPSLTCRQTVLTTYGRLGERAA